MEWEGAEEEEERHAGDVCVVQVQQAEMVQVGVISLDGSVEMFRVPVMDVPVMRERRRQCVETSTAVELEEEGEEERWVVKEQKNEKKKKMMMVQLDVKMSMTADCRGDDERVQRCDGAPHDPPEKGQSQRGEGERKRKMMMRMRRKRRWWWK